MQASADNRGLYFIFVGSYCCKTAPKESLWDKLISMKKKIPDQFSSFAKKKHNAAVKEEFKQEKRKWKKERAAFFEKKKTEGVQGTRYKGQEIGRSVTSIQQPATNLM